MATTSLIHSVRNASLKILACVLLGLTAHQPLNAQNCSFNGNWNGSSCDCDPGWTGSDCSELMILPAAPSSVYNPAYVDAWGASILKDDSGIYHMWVSVTDNNCDIQYWARNSLVVHATSSSPTGPYVYQDDAFPVMAHEIDVKRGPGGNWVAFLTAGVDANGELGHSNYGAPCDCDSTTQLAIGACNFGASTEPTVICTASSPYGPWSDPLVILKPDTLIDGIDANFSAVVHDDSSLVGLWRTYPQGSQVHWVRATNYLDPSSYEWQEQETSLFPAPYDGLTPEGLEDMFVYYDEDRDVYHALIHDMVVPSGASFYDGLGHAYSTDGENWTYTGEAADASVQFTNGTSATSARARPHFLIEDGQITHLITAEQMDANDWTYTLIEPIDTSAGPMSDGLLFGTMPVCAVYPNPTEDMLYVEAAEGCLLILRDVFGKTLFEMSTASAVTKMDMSVYPQGVYLLHVQTPSGSFSQRVVKR